MKAARGVAEEERACLPTRLRGPGRSGHSSGPGLPHLSRVLLSPLGRLGLDGAPPPGSLPGELRGRVGAGSAAPTPGR